LSNCAEEADSINTFKNRLDEHWINIDVVFNYNSELTGTGWSCNFYATFFEMRADRIYLPLSDYIE